MKRSLGIFRRPGEKVKIGMNVFSVAYPATLGVGSTDNIVVFNGDPVIYAGDQVVYNVN